MNKIRSWNDVTIAMWQELSNIQTESEITREIEQISILTDKDSEEIRNMPMNEYGKWRSELDFVKSIPTAEVQLTFELDGERYGMIPQLDFISAGEWIDAENWKENPIDNLHLYSAMIYRPITKEKGEVYEIEPHKASGFVERSNLFKNKLPITTVHGAVLFFSSSAIGFMPILVDYLESQAQEDLKLMKMNQTQTPTKTRKQRRSKRTGDSTI
jgi:hypothetical protein